MCCRINPILSFKNEAFGNDETIAVATIKRQAFMNEKYWVNKKIQKSILIHIEVLISLSDNLWD